MPSFKFILLSLLLAVNCKVYCGDTLGNRWSVEGAFQHGFLLAHRPLIVPLQQDHMKAFEACFIRQTNDAHQWKTDYNYPQTGISFAVYDPGNREKLGYAYSIMPFIDFPLAGNRKNRLSIRFGWGAGYIEKNFDPDENYKNVAIGSRFNFALALQGTYHLNMKRISLGIGPSITHFSNGSMVTPNLGINLVGMKVSAAYRFGEPVVVDPKISQTYAKRNILSFFGSVSLKQIYPAKGKNYFASTLSGNYSFHRTRKTAFGFGADIFYDNSILLKLKERDLELNNDFEKLKAGIHAAYELKIAEASIVLNMGGYLYSRLNNDGSIYHRFGIRYHFKNNIFVCMHLKSHWGKADYIEWGIGYRLINYRN